MKIKLPHAFPMAHNVETAMAVSAVISWLYFVLSTDRVYKKQYAAVELCYSMS
jgi:hypothetical protein